MIPQEQADKFLESRKLKIKDWVSLRGYDDKYVTLARIIIQDNVFSKKTIKKTYFDDKRENTSVGMFIAAFGDDFTFNPFASRQGEKLAIYLFGKTVGKHLKNLWELIDEQSYQTGFEKRSFRSKPHKDYLLKKLLELQNLYRTKHYSSAFFNMSIEEIVRYNVYDRTYTFSYIIASELNNGNKKLQELILDILNAEDEIGGVTNDIISAMLQSHDQDNWKAVGKLLLAAQRQEGLRQSILETLDLTSVGSLKYMIHLILENDLMRFSSVVRAVDVWFGFGWEAPKKSTIKRVLSIADRLFTNPEQISELINSKDNLEIYVALWVKSIIDDVESALQFAKSIILTERRELKLLAFMFVEETKRDVLGLSEWIDENLGKHDLLQDYFMLKTVDDLQINEAFFDRIISIAASVPKAGKVFSSEVFSWTNYKITNVFFYQMLLKNAKGEMLKKLSNNISHIPSEIRSNLIKKIFPKHYQWSTYYINEEKPVLLTLDKNDWKRNVLRQAIADRNESVMATGLNVLRSIQLYQEEFDILTHLLTRKNKELRSFLFSLLLKQKKDILQSSIDILLVSKNAEQRRAGLELLEQLNEKKKYPEYIAVKIAEFKQRPKLLKNEIVYLDKYEGVKNEYSFENGFGVIDYSKFLDLYKPQNKLKSKNIAHKLLSKISTKHLYSKYVNLNKTRDSINDLIAIFKENEKFEYTFNDYLGNSQSVLISEGFHRMGNDLDKDKLSKKAYFNLLPLAEKWERWHKESGLNDYEMLMAYEALEYKEYDIKLRAITKRFLPKLSGLAFNRKEMRWNGLRGTVKQIVKEVLFTFCDLELVGNFIVDVFETGIATFPDFLKSTKFKTGHWGYEKEDWTVAVSDYVPGHALLDEVLEDSKPDLQLRYWQLRMYLYYMNLSKNNDTIALSQILKKAPKNHLNTPKASLTILLYQNKKINEHELIYHCLINEEMLDIFEEKKRRWHQKIVEIVDFPRNRYNRLKDVLLNIEYNRGEKETEVTKYVTNFERVAGMHHFFKALSLLGKEKFSRGYYYWNSASKKESLSKILKVSHPDSEDSVEDFITQAKAFKYTKKRWLEIAMYAPQWADWIGNVLNINKLESAVWWFHAHASDYMNAEKETIVSRYTDIEKSDLTRGVLDLDWFFEVYNQLGKTNWNLLNESAKYISDGNGHRLVKLYSSVIMREIKITQTLEKIKSKRDKDYVKALGLVPLSKTVPEKDLLKRYNLLQDFLKESKQFGQQRQESEKQAVEIAMINLSRTAGYADSIRLTLAMEAKATQEILKKSTLSFEDAEIKLLINNDGKAEILVIKNGKSQKSIPAKYKKHKDVKELQKGKAYFRKQYSRTRKFLEDAMVNEEMFSVKDIEKLMQHPILKALLSKLVLYFKEKNQTAYWTKEGYKSIDGSFLSTQETDICLVAHPAHLYQTVEWDLYQKDAFNQKLVQPFKQIFRELYLITKDEKEKGDLSERYQGHQIQTKKTVALLRSRGWTVSYEEGLQKVFHQKNYIATMYAMADWFSPSDIEAPTLEYISFESRKDYKRIKLEKIDTVTFSEVMRDIDLVVSVAHVGGVDPEASHSTLEMRQVLAKETARLFKYTNVEVKERHIVIDGKLARYAIHLGSGGVSINGLSLSIIPVHSQHRGRMFLPFVDDDPKLAEIISKMKLLAEDNKIQDPTILAQITGR